MRARRIPFRFLPIPCTFLDDWIGDIRIRRSHIAVYMVLAEAEFTYRRPRLLTQPQIADRAHLARRTVQLALDDLQSLRMVESQGVAKRPRFYRLHPARKAGEIIEIGSARRNALRA